MRPLASRLVALVFGACLFTAPASALATAGSGEIEASKQAGLSYLRSQQQPNGSFPGFGGEWTLTSFASSGVAAASVKVSNTSTDARTYYREVVGNTETWPGGKEPPVTDFETAALAAYAGGIDPARVSARQNLIAQIAAHYDKAAPGYYGELSAFNGSVFALLALADTHTRKGASRVPGALLRQTIAVVRRNQHTDGGWTFRRAEGNKEALEAPAEAELTGAAMASLCTAGVASSDPAIHAAEGYLAADLAAEASGDGAFATEFGANTDSNAWAIQGLNACGVSAQGAQFTTSHGKTPIDYVISQQLGGGGFRFQAGESAPNLYSSQDAVRALAGAGFTATPPKPHGSKQWVYEKQFSAGVPTKLALIVDDGSESPHACAVTVTPLGPKAKLASVLEAAESTAEPAGCVAGFTPASGNGPITSIGGVPAPPQARWKVSLDGGAEKTAKRNTPIAIGDTIYLRLS
jgi:hypothetical protein